MHEDHLWLEQHVKHKHWDKLNTHNLIITYVFSPVKKMVYASQNKNYNDHPRIIAFYHTTSIIINYDKQYRGGSVSGPHGLEIIMYIISLSCMALPRRYTCGDMIIVAVSINSDDQSLPKRKCFRTLAIAKFWFMVRWRGN